MPGRFAYSDERIVQVYYWAVIHDRPTSWACRPESWPPHLRRRPLPSPSRMSRRLRSPSVAALLTALDRRVLAPARPGLFQGTVNGVNAFAKYMNSHGKLAGRNVQVDFIDSHLSADEARNAVIRACQEDFAMVGTNALFLNNVQPMEQCVDKAGQMAGLPDVPTLQAETAHQCSPISFAIIAAAIDCSTVNQHPQTYTARVGQILYYKKQNKDLHGIWVLPSDLQSTIMSTTPIPNEPTCFGPKLGASS